MQRWGSKELAVAAARHFAERRTRWWRKFKEASKRDHLSDEEIQDEIAARMVTDPEVADAITDDILKALNAPTMVAVSLLGTLHGSYYRDSKPADGFFRSTVELLMQCTADEIEVVGRLMGRLVCIQTNSLSRDLAVNHTLASPESDSLLWHQSISDVDFAKQPSTRSDILAAVWSVRDDIRRIHYLLTSTGLAQRDAQRFDFTIHYDDAFRLHDLIRVHGIAKGEYRYVLREVRSQKVVQIEQMQCWGYSQAVDEAVVLLKRNLAYFVDDADEAKLTRAHSAD